METSPLSPLHAWAAEQGKPTDRQAENKEVTEMTELFMAMLQNVSANPLSETSPAESIRVIQDLVKTRAAIQEGERLKSMVEALQANNRLQSASLVGKVGEFASGEFHITHGVKPRIAYEVPQGSNFKDVQVNLFNNQGFKLGQFQAPAQDGYHSLNDHIKKLPDGKYVFQVLGVSQEGQIGTVSPLSTAKIDRVFFKDGHIFIDSGGNIHAFDTLKGLYPENGTSSFVNALQGITAHA